MEFTFGMLAVWLFIFYVERSIVKADGMPFLAIIFEAFGADLRPRAEAWFLASLFLIHIFFGTHATVSYTHLDVYKRQEKARIDTCVELYLEGNLPLIIAASKCRLSTADFLATVATFEKVEA